MLEIRTQNRSEIAVLIPAADGCRPKVREDFPRLNTKPTTAATDSEAEQSNGQSAAGVMPAAAIGSRLDVSA
jgi:hypothetical protein